VTQKDKRHANSVQNLTRKNELINALKGFPESWKRLFAKTVSIPVCGIEKDTLQRETIRPGEYLYISCLLKPTYGCKIYGRALL